MPFAIALRIPGLAPASDTAPLVRNVFVTMPLAAVQTSRLSIFPAVTTESVIKVVNLSSYVVTYRGNSTDPS